MTSITVGALLLALTLAGCSDDGAADTGADADADGGGSCREGWADCDRPRDGDCETRLADDLDSCGACGARCAFDNAVGQCRGGECRFVACETGFHDVDEDLSNGCELECDPGSDDEPDQLFYDANCDGIDGDASRALFVAESGDDGNDGTMGSPLATISVAMALAAGEEGIDHVYVSEGTYVEQLLLVDGVSLWGGFSADDGWDRGPAHVTRVEWPIFAEGAAIIVDGEAIPSPTVFGGFEVIAPDAEDADVGATSCGLRCVECPGLVLEGNVIVAGRGGDGAPGSDGSPGADGGAGGDGGSGTCDSSSAGSGGSGGASSCGRFGGSGGRGGSEGAHSGDGGGRGSGGTAGGPGGSWGDPGGDGRDGDDGRSGGDGGDGAGGVGGLVAEGFWLTADGEDGWAGTGGGGGGGGGGGQSCTLFCDDGAGDGGGGGGGGGCGGSGGEGGGGGGASLGVLLVRSPGALLLSNVIESSDGGDGGQGGAGAPGGQGAPGGRGNGYCSGEVGAGGDGGRGGDGGASGCGGGGAGGPSIAVLLSETEVDLSDNDLLFGLGGQGGESPGSPGHPGAAGPTF